MIEIKIVKEIVTVIEKQKPFSRVTRFFKKIGKRNLFIALAIIGIVAVVAVNWAIFAGKGAKDGYGGYELSAGMQNGNEQDYFAQTMLSRTRSRDESKAVLEAMTKDEAADEASKKAAYETLRLMTEQADAEVKIESLILAKGFERCVAVVNEGGANIVVKNDGELTPAQLAQINDIVLKQSGITPENVEIIAK